MRGALDRVPPGSEAVVLWDSLGDLGEVPEWQIIRVRDTALDALGAVPESTTFVYACTQDDLGLPFIARLHQMGRKYISVWSAQPIGYISTNTVAREALEAENVYQRAHGFAKWDFGPGDFIGLVQALEITRALPGCYLEVGCFRGSSGGAVLRYMALSNLLRECHFTDVFGGFDYPAAAESSDAVWAGTHKTEGLDAVTARLGSYAQFNVGLAGRINVHRANIITDPLPSRVQAEGIAVANLDVDLHEAVLAGLTKIAPLVRPGGIIVVEDPGHTPLLIGARLALETFLSRGGRADFLPVAMDSGQTFLIRRW